MLHLPTKSAKRIRRLLHPGLLEHAKKLGVHYGHLHMVLMGQRKSPKLLARYEALTGKPHVFPSPAPRLPTSVSVAPLNETPKGPTE